MRVFAATLLLAAAGCAAVPDGRDFHRTDERFAQVRNGMTRDELVALVGRPDRTMAFPLSRSEAWDYVYQDGFGYLSEMSFTFAADGHIASRTLRRINDGGDHGGGSK